MIQSSADFSNAPGGDGLAAQRLDGLFQSVSALIVAVAALMVWNVNTQPTPAEPLEVVAVTRTAPAPLSGEWARRRPDASFDEMFRSRR